VWFTLKDSGRVQVISATPPFKTIAVLATGPITNHVNFAVTGDGRQLAYISVAGAAAVQVWTTDSRPARVATVEEVGFNPHGVWPSGDGRRVYVALQGGNAIAVIDTSTNTLAATIPAGGQGPMALAYVPNAIPAGAPPAVNLSAPGVASGNNSLYLVLAPPGAKKGDPLVTRVTLNRQGFIDQLEATVAGIKTGGTYVLALSPDRAGTAGELQPIAQFSGNADGAANPATVGTFRFALGAGGASAGAAAGRRYLVVAEFAGGQVGRVLQVQQE
jgi:YVTN family beta-propeller protein